MKGGAMKGGALKSGGVKAGYLVRAGYPEGRRDEGQSSEFRVYSSLQTANRLSWPYKPCLASNGQRRYFPNV